jgi:hypothetical protein
MGKKVYAVTNIKHDDELFVAGDEIDTGKFSKEQLRELYDNGALELRDEADAPASPTYPVVPPPDTEVVNPDETVTEEPDANA